MGHLFYELKRRNIFRVAVAYLVVGWLLVQILQSFAPALGLAGKRTGRAIWWLEPGG